ncbi:MAG: hypothetical protein AMXMBFR22_33020 [Phycisphaerae bacterium]
MTTDVFSLCAATLMGFPLQGSGAATPDEIKVLARSPGALSRVVVSDDRLLTCRLGGALEEPKKYARVLLRVISNNQDEISTEDYFVGIYNSVAELSNTFVWTLDANWVYYVRLLGKPTPTGQFSLALHRFPVDSLVRKSTSYEYEIDVRHPQVLIHPASGRIPTPATAWLELDPLERTAYQYVFDDEGQFRRSRDESIHGPLEQMHWDVRMADAQTVELYLTVNRRLSIWRGREGRRITADGAEADWTLHRLTDIRVDGPFVTIEGGRALIAAEGDHWVRVSLDDADGADTREKGAGARAGASRPIVRRTEGEGGGEAGNRGKGDGKGEDLLVIDDRDRRTTWLATRDRLLDLEGRTIAPLRLSDDPSEPYPAILRALRAIPHDPR